MIKNTTLKILKYHLFILQIMKVMNLILLKISLTFVKNQMTFTNKKFLLMSMEQYMITKMINFINVARDVNIVSIQNFVENAQIAFICFIITNNV